MHWSTTAGSLSARTGSLTTLSAPSNATPLTVTATFPNGTSLSANFKVWEPSGPVRAVILRTNNVWHAPVFTNGQAGAEMELRIYIGPTNVSLARVAVMEVGKDQTNMTGYFTN